MTLGGATLVQLNRAQVSWPARLPVPGPGTACALYVRWPGVALCDWWHGVGLMRGAEAVAAWMHVHTHTRMCVRKRVSKQRKRHAERIGETQALLGPLQARYRVEARAMYILYGKLDIVSTSSGRPAKGVNTQL